MDARAVQQDGLVVSDEPKWPSNSNLNSSTARPSQKQTQHSTRRALDELFRLTPSLTRDYSDTFKSRAAFQVENLALRHQLAVLHRSVKRPKLTSADRLLWAWLCDVWNDWRSGVVIVEPETVIAWHRKGFRLFWTSKVRSGQPGRPAVPKDVRELIRKMSRENPLWGAPRIHGELLKLGVDIGETSVAKYMVRQRKPPSQTWRTFLENHVKTLVSVDFFTVPTIRFQVLYVFLPRSGLPGNSAMPFRGTPRHVICCGIAIGSSARNSRSNSRTWESKKFFLRRDLLGNGRTLIG